MAITYEKVPRIFGQELPDHRNASAMAEYSELDLDSYLQTQVKSLLADSKPIDTSYYRKNVEDHLLFMSPDLAKQASYVDALIYAINDFYEGLTNRVNNELPLPKSVFNKLPPQGYINYANLHTHRKQYRILNEFAIGLRDYVFALRNTILDDTKDMPNPLPLFDKVGSVRPVMEEGDKDFLKVLFPSQSSSTFSSETA